MKKIAISTILVIVLCFGCGNEKAEENIENQPEVMEEPEQAVDAGNMEESEEKLEETTSVRCDSIDQLEIQGRTQEETALIQKILLEDKEEFEEFFVTEKEFSHEMESILIGAYDFTGDGKDEILVCESYVNNSALLTYNYVYDQSGRRMLEFIGGGDEEIIVGWDGEGTFLFHTMNHYAAHYNADIYTDIRLENGTLTENVVLMELDRRYGGDDGKEEYYIFKDFTKEEEAKLWHGDSGVNELTKIKKCFKEGEEPEAYRKLFEEKGIDWYDSLSVISVIVYSEEDGFVEFWNKNME